MLKFLGGTFLMIGAVIGGGILAIPIVSANFGFLTTLIFIVLAWMIMTKTGLYVLQLSLTCPEKQNSYYSIVGKYLGDKVQIMATILFLWILYFSLSSYISGSVSLIMSHIPSLSYLGTSIAYVVLLGSLMVISAKIIVRINVVLVVMKLTLLLLVIFYAHSTSVVLPMQNAPFHLQGSWPLFLIIINAFGFQFIVPSLVSYYGRDNAVIFKRMLVVSTTTVLLLYIAWLYTIYSIIPMHGKYGLQAIYQSSNQLLAFNTSLLHFLHAKAVIHLLSWFEIVALFGSFFCVSLGVFHFLADIFNAKNRLIIGFATFMPPLLLTLLSENMYIHAMSAAGYIAIILEIIIPVLAKHSKLSTHSVIAYEIK